MNFKRLFSVFLCALFIFALTGCAKNDPDDTSSKTPFPNSDASSNGDAEENKVSDLYFYDTKLSHGPIPYTVDATSEQFGADPTGKQDSSDAIQSALDFAAFTQGGGTVFLPDGEYLVTKRIFMRESVTLRGEYNDMESGSPEGLGTVLCVKTDSRFDNKTSVIQLCSSTALEGITFYYPDQNIDNVQDYYFTIDAKKGTSSATLKNINLINSYAGILISDEESTATLCNFEGIKGTVLFRGYESHREADIQNTDSVYFSPKYWAKMGEKFNAPDENSIRNFMKSTDSVGFYLADIDRSCFSNCLIDGFDTGIYNPEMKVAGLSGSYYNIKIADSRVGIDAYGIDTRYGLNLTRCSIEGSRAAIINHTQTTGNATDGEFPYISLCDSTTKGGTEGFVSNASGGNTKAEDSSHDIVFAHTEVFNAVKGYGADRTGKTDASAAIQAAIDAAYEKGGGTVYLPAGKYLIENSIVLKERVTLLGAMTNPVYSNQYGTRLYINYGLNGEDQAAIRLGKQCNMQGFTVVYPQNAPTDQNFSSYEDQSTYAISLSGEDCGVSSICFVNTGKGIEVTGAKNFVVSYIFGNFWSNAVSVDGSDGIVYRLFSNAHYFHATRKLDTILFADWINQSHVIDDTEHSALNILLDQICQKNLTLLKIKNSDVRIFDAFHYGAKQYLQASGSKIFNLNGESGRLSASGKFYTISNGTSVRHVNAVCRTDTSLLSSDGSTFVMYNLSPASSKQYTFEK